MVILMQCKLVQLARPCSDAEVSELPSSHWRSGHHGYSRLTFAEGSYGTVAAACHHLHHWELVHWHWNRDRARLEYIYLPYKRPFSFWSPRGCSYVDERSRMTMPVTASTLPYHLQACFSDRSLDQKSQHMSNHLSLFTCRCYSRIWERNLLPCSEPAQLLE